MALSFMDKDKRCSKYKIGRHTYGTPRVEDCWNNDGVTLQIGSFCSIARDVTIWLGGNHRTEWISTSPLNYILDYGNKKFNQTSTKGSVIIGNDVWIGAETTILSGVVMGDGVVIGAGSVVASGIPSYCVAAGNPAKVVRKRFSDGQIQRLLEIQWWNWDDNKIKENIPSILSDNIDGFIKDNEK